MSYAFPSSNGEEPPQRTISSLPEDLLMSCFARVSRLYYPTLSLVSKKFRTLLASPELYKARSLLRRTESCLYVCFCEPGEPNPRWFILCRKPNGKKKKKKKNKSFGYVLATIPQSPSAYPGVVVAVGSNIYSIGCYSYRAPPSSSVSILDCRSHTWQVGTSMRAERMYGHANVCDGKIYVAGGCEGKIDSSNWMEVYDPKTLTWETVLSPVAAEKCVSGLAKSAVIGGEIIIYGNSLAGLAYKPEEDRWTSLALLNSMYSGWNWPEHCVIDNVLYCYSMAIGGIIWYDSNVELWVKVIGLNGLPKIPNYSFVRLVCYGGKMAFLWQKAKPYTNRYYGAVWCAVIALKRRNNNEILGNIESIDKNVFTLPKSGVFDCAVTASIC